MSNDSHATYDIGEFVSYRLEEDDGVKSFRIVLEGPSKYEALIAHIVGTLRISKKDLEEWVDDESET